MNDIFHADERTMLERHLDGLRTTVVRISSTEANSPLVFTV